ncbi:MAG: hypothetical protein IJB18_10705, partial [Clostridia bacterium]|nr:hypothetical protein [Clostridia bacterium]
MEGNRKARSLLLVSGMTLALFAAQAALMKGFLLHIESAGQAMGLSALFALVYAGVMGAFALAEKPGRGTLLFAGAFTAATMIARVSMLDFVTADYNSFLSGWLNAFRVGGLRQLAEG